MKKTLPGLLLLSLVLSLGILAGCSSSAKNTDTEMPRLAKANPPVAEKANPTANPLDQDDRFEDDYEFETLLLPDPLYPWNRFWFTFNNYAMDYVARPIYTAYDFVTPTPVQDSIGNFFHNLMFPVRFVNSLLQFKFMQAGVEMSRFVLNSTYGVGGLFDPASGKKPIVETNDEDLGQTLGTWGVGEGFYLVLPLLGPSTPRDLVGRVGDYFLDPLIYLRPYSLQYGLAGTRAVNDFGDILQKLDDLNKMAIDPYSAMRDAYIQNRRAKIAR